MLGERAARRGVSLSQELRDLLTDHFAEELATPRPRLPAAAGETTYRFALPMTMADHIHQTCAAKGTTPYEEARYAIRIALRQPTYQPHQEELIAV